MAKSINGGTFSAAALQSIVSNEIKKAIAKSAPKSIALALKSDSSPARRKLAVVLADRVTKHYDGVFRSNKNIRNAVGMDGGDAPFAAGVKENLIKFFDGILQTSIEINTGLSGASVSQEEDYSNKESGGMRAPFAGELKAAYKSIMSSANKFSYTIKIPININEEELDNIIISGNGVPWYSEMRNNLRKSNETIQNRLKSNAPMKSSEKKQLIKAHNQLFPENKNKKTKVYKNFRDELLKISDVENLRKLMSQNGKESIDDRVLEFMSEFLKEKWGNNG